jgi:beta-glucosidase
MPRRRFLIDAPQDQLGSWAFDGRREDSVTVLAALKERLGPNTELHVAAGLPSCRSLDTAGFDEAVRAAERSDAVLLFLGEDANLSGECRSRAFIELPGAQLALLERLAATKRPIVLVIMAGRPLVMGAACDLAKSVLYAWHPGTMGGPALVDVLFGEAPPSGKLPITFPRTVGQVPIYHAAKNTGRPPQHEFKGIPTGTPLDPVGYDASYLDVEVTPQFPFGFGLSYTTFTYDALTVAPSKAKVGEPTVVRVRVANSGKADGVEVAQLYVRDLVGSVTRPVRELKAFRRVTLSAGESTVVEFVLTAEDLAFPGRDMATVTEAGKFAVFVGGDSQASLTAEFELV